MCFLDWTDHKNFHLVHSGGACGQVKINNQDQLTTKILNGNVVTPGSLPWMAYVGAGDNGVYFMKKSLKIIKIS